MRVNIQKWGNSLAIRIPKSFAEQISIKSGSPVDLSIDGDRLIIKPIVEEKYELKSLISEIRESNLHKEYLGDDPKGKELW